MIVRLHIKAPDSIGDSIRESVLSSIPSELSGEEADAVYEIRKEEVDKKLEKWISYSEYIKVEIDTDAGTAEVIPVNGR